MDSLLEFLAGASNIIEQLIKRTGVDS